MDIWFLEAAVPVTKTITLNQDGTITKSPYPLVSEFTSHKITVSGLPELAAAINVCAMRGWTLVKGALSRELRAESRMGTTVKEQATEWICFDLDGLELPQHQYANDVDAFMHLVGLPDVSYVVQWSASAGLPGSKGLRCHIFVLITAALSADLLKDYLKWLNLEIPHLSNQLSLTASHVAIKWPLDITACQNDKLIYISPPKLLGIQDPLKEHRVLYVKRAVESLFPSRLPQVDSGKIKQRIIARIAELRKSAGLPDVSLKFKTARKGRVSYMPGPAEERVTGEKRERGFVYLNLNGGDSWGYYYPEENPEFIYNFKGEPIYLTEELLPAYWATLQGNKVRLQTNSDGYIYLAFNDLSYDGREVGLAYNSDTQDLQFYSFGNKQKAKEWSEEHGRVITGALPFMKTIYAPLDKDVVNLERKTINTYRAPTVGISTPRPNNGVPQRTAAIIDHVFSGESALVAHFHNWMACIVQHAALTGTAWVWHGVQGTGKGLLYKLMEACLGPENCTQTRMDTLEKTFTGLFRHKQLVNVDEIQTTASLYEQGIVMPKIKQFITQDRVNFREMYSEEKPDINYANWLLTSNFHDPVRISRDDRRTNVAAYQSLPLVPTVLTRQEAREYATLLPDLEAMYWYWKTRDADLHQAATPFSNAAKQALTDISSNAIELAAEALRLGDLRYFWDAMPTTPIHSSGLSLSPRDVVVQRYKELIKRIVTSGETKLLREELVVMMQYLVTDKVPVSPVKFAQYLRHQRIELKDVWREGRKQRGYEVDWKTDPQWLATAQQESTKLV